MRSHKEHDLYHSVLHKPPDFLQDIFRFPAAFPPPHIRNDTVAAEIVTAVHNIHPGFKEKFPVSRKFLNNLIRLFPDINNHPV